MQSLSALGNVVGTLLKERRQTLAVAESSAGGVINAALVAVPGASAYYLGGGVIDAPGHACIAVSGPVEAAITVETGSSDREANMWAFARRAIELLESCLLRT
jgi:nicotinamide-nucleotide amidase